jgi:polygalacturonase
MRQPMKITAALCLACALPLGGATFNVRDFGAKGDGQTADTAAVQKALDACRAAGGTVEFPAGTYLCQPLTLRARTTVRLDAGAVLQATTNQADFMKTPGDWLQAKSSGDFMAFISGQDLDGVTLTGPGVIDGNGAAWWGEAEKARQIKPGFTLPRPNLVALDRCQNVRVENLTLRNSPKFHLVPADCENVVISNVTILAPERAANTDAIDPSGRHILITHCTLDVGDDNVAIKAGKKVPNRDFQSEDITVTGCVFLHGHGMSIGSETAGGIRHVVVRDCAFTNTENGLRIKSDVRRGGLVEDVSYENITMSNVMPAITLTCLYQQNSAGDAKAPAGNASRPGAKGGKIPMFRDIRIANLTATCPRAAGLIVGLPESCISNVVLENVTIAAGKGFEIRNARGIRFKHASVTVQKGAAYEGENAAVEGLPAAQ